MRSYNLSKEIFYFLPEISEIDKFMSLKAIICPFSISLSLFPEPICNNLNYQYLSHKQVTDMKPFI